MNKLFTIRLAPIGLMLGASAGTAAMTGVAAVGMGAGMIGGIANKPKGISAPTPRSYLGEMQDALRSQGQIQGDLLALESQYTPQYQELQRQGLSGSLGTLGNLYGEAGRMSGGLQSDYLGMQGGIYNQVGQTAMQNYQQSLDSGTRGIYAAMQQSAMNDLNAGRGLTPQMEQFAQQSARQAMAARGLSGNQAVAQEVMNSYQLGQAREDRARQFGGNMYTAGLAQTQSANAMYGQPLMASLNQMSPTALVGTAGGLYGALGAKLFTPESQYNAGIYGANQSNTTQTAIANQQAQAGYSAGLMSMAGSIGGGLLKNANFA